MDKKQKRLSDYDNSGHLGVTEMFGAILYMLVGALKKDYKYYHQVKYQKRNIWTGYVISIILIVFICIILIYFSSI